MMSVARFVIVWLSLMLAASCGGSDMADPNDAGVRDAAMSRDGATSLDGTMSPDGAMPGDADFPSIDARRRTDAGTACVGCAPCVDGETPTAFEQTLLDLPPHTWFEAPSSHMREVCVPDSVGVRGTVGCEGIISAWNSGAYDPIRRRMIIWGGGHDDYWGNELYGFDMRTGAWSRLSEPSVVSDGHTNSTFFNRDPLPDGEPVSRHTYDGLEYIAHLGKLWAHGGSRARDGRTTPLTWMWDEDDGWTQHRVGPGGFMLGSAYDPATRQVIVHTTESMHIYDIDGDQWRAVPGWGFPPLWPRYTGNDKTSVVDPRRGLFWSVGSRMVLVWNIAEGHAVTDDWVTRGGGEYSNAERLGTNHPEQVFESGGGDIYNVSAPGFDYDSAADAMVAWPNQGAPYVLNLETREWTLGNAEGAPVSRNSGGTFGRWRYVAAYNVFVLVNSVDENVYFYKHTTGCGPS